MRESKVKHFSREIQPKCQRWDFSGSNSLKPLNKYYRKKIVFTAETPISPEKEDEKKTIY